MSGSIIQLERLRGVTSGLAVKVPCICATTANITLSGLQTIDGVTVAADDRVLVKDQDAADENGIYVAASSAWTRAYDFDGDNDITQGARVFVISGTTNAATEWYVSTSDPSIGASLAFTKIVVESVPSEASGPYTDSGYTMSTARLLGRTTASTGAVEEIEVTAPLTLTGGELGITLEAGASYVEPGAITGSGLTMATSRLLGRTTASTGAVEEITVGAGLSLSGGELVNTATSSTGGKTLISSGSFSGTSATFTGIAATYAYLALQITGLSFGSNATPTVRVSTNNGSSYDSTAGNYVGLSVSETTGPTFGGASLAGASLIEAVLQSGSVTLSATITIRPYQGGTYTQWTAVTLDSDGDTRVITGYYKSTSPINALEIAGGTFDGGSYALYGVS